MLFHQMLIISHNLQFQNNLSGMLSDSQTDKIKSRADISLGLNSLQRLSVEDLADKRIKDSGII